MTQARGHRSLEFGLLEVGHFLVHNFLRSGTKHVGTAPEFCWETGHGLKDICA